MFEKACLLIGAFTVLFFSGCSPVQLGVIGGQMAVSAASYAIKNSSSSPALILGTKTGSYQINEYEVTTSDGFFKDKPCILLTAYKNNLRINSLSYEKDNSDDMAMISSFNGMGEKEKKQFIKAAFLQYGNLDLGPIETETAETETVETEKPKTASKSLKSLGFPSSSFR